MTADRLQWHRLLNGARLREVERGEASYRGEKEARSEFERDFARAVFSTPVRRLHDKAQVFPLDPNDSVRTRLTHSLEVSTVARSLARRVCIWLQGRRTINQEMAQSIEDIAATVGLLHDIGNPPFGHAGEKAIQNWAARRFKNRDFLVFQGAKGKGKQLRQDFLKFEGNAQTLRLLCSLQLISDSYGLNLTVGTLSALRKYTAASHATSADDKATKKPGHFASEQSRIGLVDRHCDTHGARNPIAYLVEACDDIVYSLVDLEDGVKKGIVTWEEIREEVCDKVPECKVEADNAQRYVERANLPRRQWRESCAQMFRTFAMNHLIPAIESSFRSNYTSIMRREFHGDLASTSDAAGFFRLTSSFLKSRVFTAPEILRLEIMGGRVIQDLLDTFLEATRRRSSDRRLVEFEEKAFQLLSFNYRSALDHALKAKELPREYCEIQAATDYVCGMTDTFACTLHRSIRNAG